MRPLSPFLLRLLLLAGLAFTGSAGAACTLQSPELSVARYAANADAVGTLSVTVACDNPLERYALDVASGNTKLRALDDRSWSLQTGERGGARLLLVLRDEAGQLRLPQQGTGRYVFPLRVPAGQWDASGALPLGLTVTLSPLKF